MIPGNRMIKTDKPPKPCPFCGGVSIVDHNDFYYVYCDNCGCSTEYLDDPNEAVAVWNRRCRKHKKSRNKRMVKKSALAAPARPCDTMDWRDAWAKWRTEVKPQKPETYGEAYEGTEAFLDWFTTPMKGE